MEQTRSERKERHLECCPPSSVTIIRRCSRCSHLEPRKRCWTACDWSVQQPLQTTSPATSLASLRRRNRSRRMDWRPGLLRVGENTGCSFAHLLALGILFAVLECNLSLAFFLGKETYEGPVEIVNPPRNVSVRIDEAFNITCTARAGPFPHMTLKHNGVEQSFRYIVPENALGSAYDEQDILFEVPAAGTTHAGEYKCTIIGGRAREASATAYVTVTGEGKPVVHAMENQVITEGTNVRIPCRAHGWPTPDIKWQLPNTISPASQSTMRVDASSTSLHIDSVRVDHGGRYTCMVTNSHGTVTTSMRLSVIPLAPPTRTTTPTTAPDSCTGAGCASKKSKRDFLGISDRDLIIIIACSGAIIVTTCITTLMCYIHQVRSRMYRRNPPSSPPTSHSQIHSDSTTGTIATRSPSQTIQSDDDRSCQHA